MYLTNLRNPFLRKYMLFYYYYSLIMPTIGIISNLFMILVFTRPQMRKLTVWPYMVAMSVVNCLINLNWLKFTTELDFEHRSQLHCKLVMFIGYIICPIAAWFLVAASFDRFVTIVRWSKFRITRKSYFPFLVITGIVLFNMAVYSFSLFDYNIADNYCGNTANDGRVEEIIDTVQSILLPFVAMLFFLLAMVIAIARARRRVKSWMSSSSVARRKTQARDMRFAVTQLVLSFLFLVLNAIYPFYSALVYYLRISIDSEWKHVIFWSLLSLNCLFYAIQFFVQLGVNSHVRRQFFQLFMCKRYRKFIIQNSSIIH